MISISYRHIIINFEMLILSTRLIEIKRVLALFLLSSIIILEISSVPSGLLMHFIQELILIVLVLLLIIDVDILVFFDSMFPHI